MHSNSARCDTILQQIISHLPNSTADGKFELLRRFIGAYLDHLDIDDMSEFATEDLYGAAVAHWELAQRRSGPETLVRVYNPVVSEHGWQSTHTIIEVVTPDAPYLVASLTMKISELGLNNHLVIHPIMNTVRNTAGDLSGLHDEISDQSNRESFMHFEIDRVAAEPQLTIIRSVIINTLALANRVQKDTKKMQSCLTHMKAVMGVSDNRSTQADAVDFFNWLNDHHFAVLGACSFDIDDEGSLTLRTKSRLGILRPPSQPTLITRTDNKAVPSGEQELDHFLPSLALDVNNSGNTKEGQPILNICKGNLRSPLLRPENLDVITVRESTKAAVGRDTLHCIAGLFAPFVKQLETASIPILASKTKAVFTASGLSPDSHTGKSLQHTLESFPRDLLFQSDTDTLLRMGTGIVNLQERLRIRLFGYISPGVMYANCLVYIPHENYSRDLRLAIESILLSDLKGTSSDFDSQFSSESALARIHYTIRLSSPITNQPDWSGIESRIVQAAITWDDRLQDILLQHYDESAANLLYRKYYSGFPSSYKEDYSARVACADIAFMEESVPDDRPVMSFYRNILADSGTVNFKLFSPNDHIALSDVIPIIENMGLRVESEHPFQVTRQDQSEIWIHEFTVQHIEGKNIEARVPAKHIEAAFERIWTEQVENDGFNRLILEAGIDWRETVILRSYCKYLLQIQVPFSQEYMIATLVSNGSIAKLLVCLFEQRFDPRFKGERSSCMRTTRELIEDALGKVESLDQDRILRAYLNLVMNTLRTNYYVKNENDAPLSYLSFKIDSAKILDLPLPRPKYEIFVYSPNVEGIHLRGGKVARGGLRWSDRREDFRTEVLGLMKAQMVKNAVIVPVGSKGGFYVKNPPTDPAREAQLAEGINCYQIFLRGLLDVTDNINGNSIVAPKNVVRHDEDDPYLVVAADKGTATFSDHANGISEEYGFWLGDAFASGGSVGYDHKKMGITARGAWESVKRHFRELALDTQTTPFTVVGIGDMAGDVFGNGMLLSKHINLVAAFNHLHIFIDPDPDAASAFEERQRLFKLPRSSWTDYDKSLLSEGGEIYSRSAKEINLSAQAKQALGITETNMTPNQLINKLLQAPVDLLWNGGIGTYIKARSESNSDASDRANDTVRVNGDQLRCRVFGEGGNLGATQLGRIEMAASNIMLFTDAIDNSAGVDCSDHEVNIKIALNSLVENGDMTTKQRDLLLADMTDKVASLVLKDNYLQTQCINITHSQAAQNLEEHSRLIAGLETADKLDRAIEYLPDAEEIAERLANNQGLTRPELAVLVSYSKMTIYEEILDSSLPDDPALVQQLIDYFPENLSVAHEEALKHHRLRREIIATIVTNQLINRLGPSFVSGMQEELGCDSAAVAHAFVAVCEIFNMESIWCQIESLDNKITAANQTSMHVLVRGLVERAVHWLLRSRRPAETIDALVAYFKPGITELINSMPECLASANRRTLDERCKFFTNAGVPLETARNVAAVVPLSSALDIVEIGKSCELPVAGVAAIYFELGVFLDLHWLRDEIAGLVVRTHWHTRAKSELRSDIHYQQRHLCAEVVTRTSCTGNARLQVQKWAESSDTGIKKYSAIIGDMKAASSVDFAMLSLAVNEVHKLLRSDRPLAS